MYNCGRLVRVYKYAYIGNSIHKPYSTIMLPAHYTRICNQTPNSSKDKKKHQTLTTPPLPVKKNPPKHNAPLTGILLIGKWSPPSSLLSVPEMHIVGCEYIYMCVVHHVFITYFVQISKADTKKSDWLRSPPPPFHPTSKCIDPRDFIFFLLNYPLMTYIHSLPKITLNKIFKKSDHLYIYIYMS